MEAFLSWFLGPLWVMAFDRSRAARQATLLSTLAVAVEKQFPVGPFLEALADEAGGRWRWKMRGLADLLSSGISIPEALEAMPGVLPVDAVGLVRIGAQSGNMSGALREAAGVARRRSEHTGMRFQGTFFYLCMLLFLLGFFATFIMIWIIPKFKAIFDGFDSKLPPLTEAVITICDYGAAFWYLFILLPLILLGAWLAMAVSLEAMGWGPAWTHPRQWTADLWPRFRTPHVLRCLSVAVDAGRPLADVLTSMVERHPDMGLRSRLSPIADAVAAGEDCWHVLRKARMLRAGEAALLEAARRAGNLAWALREMAGGIERRAEYRYQLVMEFVHPAMILVVGGIIGTFCVSIFLPLITLVSNLS